MGRERECARRARGMGLIMDADTLYRWAQAIALIAAMLTTLFTIVRLLGEDRLVKRQMERLDELEKISSVAPKDLSDHVRTLQREVVADYLATVISGSWRRIGLAKLPMAGLVTGLAMFSILTGTIIASPMVGMGLRNVGFLIPFSLLLGLSVAGMVGWQVLGPIMGRRLLREELHHRFTRRSTIEGVPEEIDLPPVLRRGGNIVGAAGAIVMSLGLTAGTIAALGLMAGVAHSALVMASESVMLVSAAFVISIAIVVSKGPEKYGELITKKRHP